MSASSSTTQLEDTLNHIDILKKIESQRALGEYSPASSTTATRPPSIIEKLEEGNDGIQQTAAITYRPTGFKVFSRPIPSLT